MVLELPRSNTIHLEALGGGEVTETQTWTAAADTLVWGGRRLFVTNWLFFSLKRILLEKS